MAAGSIGGCTRRVISSLALRRHYSTGALPWLVRLLPLFAPVRVLGRRSAVRLDDAGVRSAVRLEIGLLEHDAVAPLVANVEEVQQALPRPEPQPRQTHAGAGRARLPRMRWMRELALCTPGAAAEEEGIEVIVIPAKRLLN